MTDVNNRYTQTTPEDQKKAKVFFDRAAAVAGSGQYDYAIEMYIEGLGRDPEAVEAHKALREIALKRKVTGGKDLGLMKKLSLKRPTRDDKQNMLNAEKLLAYDPGNTDLMLSVFQNAHRAGFYETVLWMGPILLRANTEDKKPSFEKYIALKNVYRDIDQFKLATDAAHHAAALKPDDSDLQHELKELAAQLTMSEGKYGTAGSFRDSVRDSGRQRELMEQDADIRSADAMAGQISRARAEFEANPDEPAKLVKLVELLVKTEDPEQENHAIDLLEQQYQKTKQYRFKFNIGQIKMGQMSRMERSLRKQISADPENEQLREQYAEFVREQNEEELAHFQEAVKAYPTDLRMKYEVAVRLFKLGRHDEAIPMLQQAMQDPKFREEAGVLLGRSFLEANFVDEAVDTLRDRSESYPVKGDKKSKELTYWYGRALQKKGDTELALKQYSQIAQWDFGYRDVQQRIKTLRAG